MSGKEITEHAIEMSSGDMCVRSTDADLDRIYPLDKWIEIKVRNGQKVYRRRVILVEDWVEVQ